ncbi:hypothetical protein H8F22_02615 [Pseudomonas sp. P154a]|uniref:hypothetical protein n=1 Tax=Pseudomonas mucoides TaxID=2730424 RepID=UPI00189204F3|nr:hypothetical protein [Pseudomonas mucoides]MBF6037760.1 hypothetical protein [Pseudomonas mucoides]
MGRVFFERWLLLTYCLLLFASGCIFGFIFTKDGQVGLVSFLGGISSLATVGAAITAVVAMNSWKAQFQLQKKYDAVIFVRAFLHEASHPLIYLSSLSNHFSAYILSRNDRALANNYPDEIQRKWFDHASEFGKAWDVMTVFLSKSELESFGYSPTAINQMVRVAKDALIETAFGNSMGLEKSDEAARILGLQNILRTHTVKIESAYVDMEKQSRVLLGELTS